MKLCAEDSVRAITAHVKFRGAKHSSRGAAKYTQTAVHTPANTADPTVRAGLMLNPETGAKNRIYSEIRIPTK